MDESKIDDLLAQHWRANLPDIKTRFSGVEFEKPDSGLWASLSVVITNNTNTTIEENPEQELTGFFMISIFDSFGGGMGKIKREFAKISKAFQNQYFENIALKTYELLPHQLDENGPKWVYIEKKLKFTVEYYNE